MRRLKTTFAIFVGLTTLGATFPAFAANPDKTNFSNEPWQHSIPKTPIPKDPRGPLPKDGSQWNNWIKNHPDTMIPKKSITLRAAAVKSFPEMSEGALIFGAKSYNSSSSSAPYGYFRHEGLYDENAGNFLSAMPNIGVYREPVSDFQTNYGDVSIDYVTMTTMDQRNSVVTNASYHIGEGYFWATNKTDPTEWYCSKLTWFEYNRWAGIDTDSNGGYWVTPDDMYNSSFVVQNWRG